MFLFKTSGQTLASVVANQKHAFAKKPRDWHAGERVLVSKNSVDCAKGEKQIQFLMSLDTIRKMCPGESEHYWPRTEGRWPWLVLCNAVTSIHPFNLKDVLGEAASEYRAVMTFKRMSAEHEEQLTKFLKSRNPGLLL